MRSRRHFLKHLATSTGAVTLGAWAACTPKENESQSEVEEDPVTAKEMFFQVSLAQWSLNKSIFGGKLDNLDFASYTKNNFGITALEYVNQFFKDKATDQQYLQEMKTRTDDLGMTNLLIMIDGEGPLGSTVEAERVQAVENHYKWVEAAKYLGCHSIRVNAAGEGTAEEVAAAAVDGLGRLTEFANDHSINVIVENHGGYSSDGRWLSGVISQVNMPGCGTLPDFGNFCIKVERNEAGYTCLEEYDRYKGTRELMPFAKGVSAKSMQFDSEGNCVETDYYRMMQIVKDSGYRGFVGIEYEGPTLSEDEGIRATHALLLKVGGQIS